MLLIIVAFAVIFSLVIFVHELGHWYFARRAGVRVEEFGFGLPPRIWGKQKGDTVYSINLIPFGGFVRLYGEADELREDKKAFSGKKPWPKLTIVVGGVLMNLMLGWAVMMIGFWLTMPPLMTPAEQYVSDPNRIHSQVLVAGVADNSPAAQSGLVAGDVILSAEGQAISLPSEFKSLVQAGGTKPLALMVQRKQQTLTISVTPTFNAQGQAEVGVLIDRNVKNVAYVWWQVPWLALQETGRVIWLVIVSIAGLIYRLVTTASLPVELSGPVGIAKITADIISLGWFKVMQFVIFLSLNLGVINLVPFPGLDGGRLVFILIEWIRRGKKIPGHIENTINTAGLLLLILFLMAVTYKDIVKLI